jgi:hypothetical protein
MAAVLNRPATIDGVIGTGAWPQVPVFAARPSLNRKRGRCSREKVLSSPEHHAELRCSRGRNRTLAGNHRKTRFLGDRIHDQWQQVSNRRLYQRVGLVHPDRCRRIFLHVLPINTILARMRRGEVAPAPTTKKCSECLSERKRELGELLLLPAPSYRAPRRGRCLSRGA